MLANREPYNLINEMRLHLLRTQDYYSDVTDICLGKTVWLSATRKGFLLEIVYATLVVCQVATVVKSPIYLSTSLANLANVLIFKSI